MRKKLDLVGQRFGRLVVIEEAGLDKHRSVLYRCKCDCGIEVTVSSNSLRRGNTTSCGCYHKERVAERLKKHGLKTSHCRLYDAIHKHFSLIKNAVKSYGDWQIDSRYTPDITGVVKFCEDLIASRPEECERYEVDRTLDLDKDNDKDRIFRPESITFVSRKRNCNNRQCTLRLSDGTAFAEFCQRVENETYNQADHKLTKQYDKYRSWFTRHNGEGHPELIKKANELIALYRKTLEMRELLNEVRAFRASP